MRPKLILIIGGAVLAVAAISYGLYYRLAFFAVSTSPRDGAKAPVFKVVTIKFNRPLDPGTKDRLVITPSVEGQISVEGRTLKFTPSDPYRLDTEYTVSLAQPRSAGGQVGKDIQFKFVADYIPYNRLDRQTQEEGLRRTDQLEDTEVLAKYLPYETLEYKISYDFTPSGEITYKITLYATLNRPEQTASYQNQLRAYKQKALDYIRSQGQDPAKLNISYEPKEAAGL